MVRLYSPHHITFKCFHRSVRVCEMYNMILNTFSGNVTLLLTTYYNITIDLLDGNLTLGFVGL